MTYQIKCKCGSEFYLTMGDETDQTICFAKEEAKKFREFHNCCDIENELPEDWKV